MGGKKKKAAAAEKAPVRNRFILPRQNKILFLTCRLIIANFLTTGSRASEETS
jgi:hypothetical protein